MIADYYSRFPVIRRVRSTTASATINILKQIFSEYGVPKAVMSEKGPQFASTLFANLLLFSQVPHLLPLKLEAAPSTRWTANGNGA